MHCHWNHRYSTFSSLFSHWPSLEFPLFHLLIFPLFHHLNFPLFHEYFTHSLLLFFSMSKISLKMPSIFTLSSGSLNFDCFKNILSQSDEDIFSHWVLPRIRKSPWVSYKYKLTWHCPLSSTIHHYFHPFCCCFFL